MTKNHWRDHLTLIEIYKELPRISSVLSSRRLFFSGHCFLAKNKILTYPDMLRWETGLELRELGSAMSDRELWREGYVMFPT